MSALFEVEGLVKRFAGRRRWGGFGTPRWLTAVDGVSFSVPAGGVLGIVGESGCGKSTLARAALRLIEPDAGTIRIAGRDFRALHGAALRRRRRDVQMVFQDAASALDPRMRAGAQVAEPLIIHGLVRRGRQGARVAALLARVGLAPSLEDRYPHQLSGGQRQRLAIARALATEPRLLVLDEPVSSLDVSVQARVLALLAELGRSGCTQVLISHDLAVVQQLANQVAVMYFGRVVEQGPCQAVLEHPRHPYTASLLAAIPAPEPDHRRGYLQPGSGYLRRGEVPSLLEPPAGCPFHPRCTRASTRCRQQLPQLETETQHAVACHDPISCQTAGEPNPRNLSSKPA